MNFATFNCTEQDLSSNVLIECAMFLQMRILLGEWEQVHLVIPVQQMFYVYIYIYMYVILMFLTVLLVMTCPSSAENLAAAALILFYTRT